MPPCCRCPILLYTPLRCFPQSVPDRPAGNKSHYRSRHRLPYWNGQVPVFSVGSIPFCGKETAIGTVLQINPCLIRIFVPSAVWHSAVLSPLQSPPAPPSASSIILADLRRLLCGKRPVFCKGRKKRRQRPFKGILHKLSALHRIELFSGDQGSHRPLSLRNRPLSHSLRSTLCAVVRFQ